MTFNSLSIHLLPVFVFVLSTVGVDAGAANPSYGLQDDYYRHSCPSAESVVRRVVMGNVTVVDNRKFAAGLLRLSFHDCFVEGCDASVLLYGPGTEKTAPVNKFLQSLEILDKAKQELEKICPGVVSCADILQYAARDGVIALNGSSWKVQGGRRDGRVSRAESAEKEIPSQDFDLDGLTASFKRKGLSRDQMVILSGAHTSAAGHCENLVRRLYNFNSTHATDPSIPAAYAAELKATCPRKTFNDTVFITMDAVSAFFDAGYYVTLEEHKGVFTSDQILFDDHRTRPLVKTLTDYKLFEKKFHQAMRAMAAIGVKLYDGEIRKDCRFINSY
ncbi:peroxidase [Marchantia polymorpha subsp. ruderalis]|uniref:Peroxidase n=2 Tax=Marchantia polymorpha TaxID=3197 RepID=A0A176VGA2_MARPO|nr:hypothetical protein AXG93_4273s1060 [Marchantia polymorpha subsp. ruderalis]PTQ47030.1 hypothetical protein MARPO_0009s0127 [Marchantia polymorpha]BBN17425.1 hypothetical protein Mp_7g14420 [Marchantia polymorpha subsp. ruderalis]|eukprot:PTQ47030.1 hypothetical protein MARPO_0009s0127 [Marchantia polymorpha]